MQCMIKASYQISLLLAQKKKSYSDGEIVKDCLSIFAENTDNPSIKALSKNIALSRNTVMRRVEEMANDVSKQIIVASSLSRYFSIAIDESCDVTDNAQLLVYIRCVNQNFDVVQDLLGLCQLQTTTTGSDIFKTLKECVENSKINGQSLSWDKLDSICTDGAPAMVGKNNGCVSLLEKYLQRKFFKYHCIIHQEVLCSKDMDFSHVIDTVVHCINKIRARALHRQEFRSLFENETDESGELLLHCSVQWLSKGKMLARFYQLKIQVLQFLDAKKELPSECDLLQNKAWLCDLAFLVDVTNYLNILNKNLQGENSLFPTLFNHINSFKAKLKLFANSLSQKNLNLFPTLKSYCDENRNFYLDFEKYKHAILKLSESFDSRFEDFSAENKNIFLFINPFSITDNEMSHYTPELQLEIMDIQNHTGLKSKFQELCESPVSPDLKAFWKFVPKNDFPELVDMALRFVCKFGSTYICEKTFSTMNFIKSKYRSTLTDSHLSNLILLSTSKINPDIDELVCKIQAQKPH